jgi:DNA-binding CsgD family transcriptional regulator
MLTEGEQDRLVAGILRNSYEAVNLEDLGSQILPLFDRLFDTSASLLYRCNERGEFLAIAGTLSEMCPVYREHYYLLDPTQRPAQRFNPCIFHAPSFPEWKEFLNHPVHIDFLTHYEFDNYVHLRLNDCGMHEPGMVGIVLARSDRQPDFAERERMTMVNLLPALEALTRRSARLEGRLRSQPFLESMLDFSPSPKVVLDLRGGFVWASERAEALLALSCGGRRTVPDALVKAARRLGMLIGKKSGLSAPLASVAVPRKDSAPIRADLLLARTRSGAYFVIGELEEPGLSPQLEETAARYQLTAAETQVLKLLSLGLTDREIGRRLFVSMPTVHSHVTHILSKLGVGSRFQAALLAHGLRPKVDLSEK